MGSEMTDKPRPAGQDGHDADADADAEDPAQALGDESADDFRALAESLPSGILSADAEGRVVFCNQAARQTLDLPAESLLGSGWESVVHTEDRADVVTAARSVLGSSPSEQVTFRVRSGFGERWVHARFVPLGLDRDRSPSPAQELSRRGWIAAIEDVTDRRRMESQMAHRATHDPLTGLPNRALLEDRLQQACARLSRGGEQAAVLFMDLNGFKEVNDRFDHRTGDEVLTEVARRLRRVLRPADTGARLGGDEFVVVCESTGPDKAAEVADRIHEALRVPFLVEGGKAEIGASIGIACTSDASIEPSELLLRADKAMYRVKHGDQSDHSDARSAGETA